MKKAMLFIVAMMFSVAANAATYTITPTNGSPSILFNGTSAVSTGFIDTTTTFNLEVADVVGSGAAKIDFDYSPDAVFQSGMLNIINTATSAIIQFALTSDFTTILNLVEGNYEVSFAVVPTTGSMNFGISAVPVPAALFLFAPALLGFLGMRRKTAVAA